MLLKRIIPILLIFFIAVLLVFVGCNKGYNGTTDSKSIIEEQEVRIIELEEMDPPKIVSSEWVSFSEEERVKMSDLIFTGALVSKKEYVIETVVSEEFTRRNYKTVYSFKVNEIFYSTNKGIEAGSSVDVLSPVTSHNWEPKTVDMETGQSYILFVRFSIDTDEIKNTDLAEYSLGNPWEPIISIKDGSYEFDEVFKSLTLSASSEERITHGNQSKKVFIREDKNFISDLNGLISTYKD